MGHTSIIRQRASKLGAGFLTGLLALTACTSATTPGTATNGGIPTTITSSDTQEAESKREATGNDSSTQASRSLDISSSCNEFRQATFPEQQAVSIQIAVEGIAKIDYVCTFKSIDTIEAAIAWIVEEKLGDEPTPIYGPPTEVLSGRHILLYNCSGGVNLYAFELATGITRKVADFAPLGRLGRVAICKTSSFDFGPEKVKASFAPNFNRLVGSLAGGDFTMFANNNFANRLEPTLIDEMFGDVDIYEDGYWTDDGYLRTILIEGDTHTVVDIRGGPVMEKISQGAESCGELYLQLPEVWPLCENRYLNSSLSGRVIEPISLIVRDDPLRLDQLIFGPDVGRPRSDVSDNRSISVRIDASANTLRTGSARQITEGLYAIGENIMEVDFAAGTAFISQPIPRIEDTFATFHFLDEQADTLYFTTDFWYGEWALWHVPLDGSAAPERVDVGSELDDFYGRAFTIHDFGE